MLGKTNASQADAKLNSNDMVCYYRAAYAVSSPSSSIAGYEKDYLSFSAPTFTVLKPFSAGLYIFGKGARNQNGSARSLTYTFKQNSTTIASGTYGSTGSNTTVGTVSFARGDTFSISGSKDSDSTTNYGDLGFCLKFVE